ncbi:molybdenum cofactor guanylyltransferase [Pseudarthrobacter sp. N5]|uniref:molybdenum cofactor guanylyltransferase n=1 Tax=Pseudarthrobacter sp. N5 TaxID=3418416 RepID=UPI003CF7B457
MEFNAIILAGGRSARLGGTPKAALTHDGATLIALSLAAARGAGTAVVVGPDPGPLPAGVLSCREDPPFSGPAAAIAAGLAALKRSGAPQPPFTLVLACDMPKVAGAVRALAEALDIRSVAGSGTGLAEAAAAAESAGAGGAGSGGVMAASQDGRKQPLVGFYGTPGLDQAVQDAEARGALADGSVFALLASLDVQVVTVPAGSTDDVDTWDDAAALGVAGQQPSGW